MTNIFKKILNELPAPKIEIIPDDLKDKEIVDQMTKLIEDMKNEQ